MIEVFALIGWIGTNNTGAIVGQEFNSLETCETAKTLYIEKHDLDDPSWTNVFAQGHSWVECVKK